MSDQCRYCGELQTVPVLDVDRAQRSVPGNKFRRFCLDCRRWLPLCSRKYFEDHSHPHVLPPNISPDDRTILSVEEYEGELENRGLDSPSIDEAGPDPDDSTVSTESPRSTPANSDAEPQEEEPLYRSIGILNRSVSRLVDRELITEREAYRIITRSLNEITPDRVVDTPLQYGH